MTLVSGTDGHGKPMDEATASQGYRAWIEWLSMCDGTCSLAGQVRKDESDGMHYNITYSTYSRLRTAVVMDPGLLGLGPVTMTVTDIVAILWGCTLPVELRPLGKGYHGFVGLAYFHGVMNGEFVGDRKARNLMEQSFWMV
jgi:hypothetical protein